MQLRVLGIIGIASTFFAGCGLVSDSFSAELAVEFTVNGTDNTYRNELTVDPQQYKDVKDNCGSIEKSTGQIRSLTVEITEIMSDNLSTFGGGSVFMRANGSGDWPAENATNAFAFFSDVPIRQGQVITLDLTPARRNALANLVFTQNCDQKVDMKLVGDADQGPVSFKGKLTFFVDFVASL